MDASKMSKDQQHERGDVDDAPVGGVGGRSPSWPSTGNGTAGLGPLATGQRWSVARKRAVVLRLIAGEPVELVAQ